MAEVLVFVISILVAGSLSGYVGFGYGQEKGAKSERQKMRGILNKAEQDTPANEKYEIKRAYGRR